MRYIIEIFLFISFISITLNGDDIKSLNKEINSTKVELNRKNNSIKPKKPPLNANRDSYITYQKALQAYYGYLIQGYKHRSEVFKWQLFSSRLLFIIVILLVFSGIYFAAVQFYAGLKNKNLDPEQLTTISISSKNIEISSPVIGIIILVLSLGFFYLYLVYVYPIKEIF